MNILVQTEAEVIIKRLENKKDEIIETNVAIIDIDYSLIRYLAKQLVFKEVILNNCGYPIIKRDNGTFTTLHRFILEYYSKNDDTLKTLLNDKKCEINHKNKNRLDSRIENLEILTHQDNIRHSKGLDYKIELTWQQLQKIQRKNIKDGIMFY